MIFAIRYLDLTLVPMARFMVLGHFCLLRGIAQSAAKKMTHDYITKPLRQVKFFLIGDLLNGFLNLQQII